jgi:hypothetical protein
MKGMSGFAPAVTLALGLGAYATAAAAPTKINSCQTLTQSGSYVLAKNLTAAGDCLVVGNDFITIDLNGFTISGQGTGSGIKLQGDCGCAGRGFEIRNGTIFAFARGIDFRVLGGAPGKNLIERIRVVDNSEFGVFMDEIAIVKDSIFFHNGVCIFLKGCPRPTESGDGLHVGRGSVVTGNTASENAGNGIVVGSGSTVIGNSADGNGANGFVVSGPSTLVNNTAGGNSNIGLSINCPSNLIGNTAVGNSQNLSLGGAGCNNEHNVAP